MTTTMEGVPVAQETEVLAKARRRRFTAAEKLRVLREADRCTKPGELSALLRREGLYSSHLSTWRAARQRGELAGLTPRARGPKAKPVDPRDKKIAELERETRRLQARLERADADLEHERPGILFGSFSGFGREESAERAAGGRAARAWATLPPVRSVSAYRANAVGVNGRGGPHPYRQAKGLIHKNPEKENTP
jgi:transposase